MSPEPEGCAAEPIRVPGAIQPHGWLVAFEMVSAKVVAYSANCTELTGLAPGAGQVAALGDLVGSLRSAAAPLAAGLAPVSIGTAVVGGRELDVTSHCVGSLGLLELEPASTQRGTQAAIYSLVHGFVDATRKAATVRALVSLAASEMKRITGFGRCIVYSFDAEGHGSVLAEDGDPGYESYLGHSFPASDIPAQARELYVLNRIRLIPDAHYTPTALHFVDPNRSAGTFDLSFAQLRSISPAHLEYMRNMGTVASMSVSIVVRGRLWGMISCHDHGQRFLDFQTRFACEHLGQLLSLLIEAREDNIDTAMRHEQRDLTMKIVSRLGHSEATLQSLADEPQSLLGLAGAAGAAVVFEDRCWCVGDSPAPEHVLALAAWVRTLGLEVYDTDHLAGTDAPALPGLGHAAGLLAISLSRKRRHLVMWFRPELLRSVRWAGEPPKLVDDQGRLHPRRSFKSWEEIVRGHSSHWVASEIAGVTELRRSLIGIVLQRVQERIEAAGKLGRVTIAKEAAEQADSAKTHFLAILSHELRTPLASITNAAELLGRNATIPERYAGLVPMIKRNVAVEARLIGDLLDMSSISAGKLHLAIEPVDMNALLAQVVEMLAVEVANKALRLEVTSGGDLTVRADPVRMQQVLWNILRNAVKFTPQGGLIEVHGDLRDGAFVLTCKDNGIGIEAGALDRIFTAFVQGEIDTHHHFGGLGLGLAIAAGIVQGHGGRLAAQSDGLGRGATFTLELPARAGITAGAVPRPPGPAVAADTA